MQKTPQKSVKAVKHPIDYQKLLTVLLDGANTYNDGRYCFQHELLIRTLKNSGITVDTNALDDERVRRQEVARTRYAHRLFERTCHVKYYIFYVSYDHDKHFDALMTIDWDKAVFEYIPNLHTQEYCSPSNDEDVVLYASNRVVASNLLKYIRLYYPDCSIKTIITNTPPKLQYKC